VSGQTYADGVVRFSPINFLSYRRKTAGAGTTDPSLDSANWALVAGTGDVTLTGTQTLTNKTLTNVVLDGSYTEEVFALTGTALNPANGTVQTITLSANTTFTDALTSGQSMILGIDDGATRSVTWPTITWTTNPATAPSLPTSGFLWVVLWKVGTTLYGKY
jgi:hypothetical protein